MPLRTGLNLNMRNIQVPDVKMRPWERPWMNSATNSPNGSISVPRRANDTPRPGEPSLVSGSNMVPDMFGANSILSGVSLGNQRPDEPLRRQQSQAEPDMSGADVSPTDTPLEKSLEIKRDKDGNVDWVASLVAAGALTAGALMGNTNLAAAGAGFLKGAQSGRERLEKKEEREQKRAEKKQERDYEREQKQQQREDKQAQQLQSSFDSAVKSGNWELADQYRKQMPEQMQPQAREVLKEARQRDLQEAQKDQRAKDEQLYARTPTDAESMQRVAALIEDTSPDLAQDLRTRATKVAQEGDVKEKDALDSHYSKQLQALRSVDDLELEKEKIANDDRLTDQQQEYFLSFADKKIQRQKKNIKFDEAQQLAKIGTPKAQEMAAERMSEYFGTDVPADAFKPEYKLNPNKAYQDMFNDLAKQRDIAQAEKHALDYVRALTGDPNWEYAPEKPAQSLESRFDPKNLSDRQQFIYSAGVQSAVKSVASGEISLQDQLKNIDEQVGSVEIPTQAFADTIKNEVMRKYFESQVGDVLKDAYPDSGNTVQPPVIR